MYILRSEPHQSPEEIMTSHPGEEAPVGLPEDVERPEDDDHDLLTFGEAGARLEIEIRTLRARLRELADPQPRDEAAIAGGAQPINDENFEKFFGYPGKARRNTTWQ